MPILLHLLILDDRLADVELMLYEPRQAGFEPERERVEAEVDGRVERRESQTARPTVEGEIQ
jgi:hypothetical protein